MRFVAKTTYQSHVFRDEGLILLFIPLYILPSETMSLQVHCLSLLEIGTQ